MTYRDLTFQCPRCRCDLERTDASDHWHCQACGGVAVGVEDLIHELVAIAPDLLPPDGVRGLSTLGRRNGDRLPCAVCGQLMEPVFLGGMELDRCYTDEQIWFDVNELDQVLDAATEQYATRHARGALTNLEPKPPRPPKPPLFERLLKILCPR